MPPKIHPTSRPDAPLADGRTATRHVFVRDLELNATVGVYAHEKKSTQRIRVNLDLGVSEDVAHRDDLGNVVCYETLAKGVRDIVARGHVNLVETLAERIADHCLADPRVTVARIRVEKLDALPDAASVGIEIERRQH